MKLGIFLAWDGWKQILQRTAAIVLLDDFVDEIRNIFCNLIVFKPVQHVELQDSIKQLVNDNYPPLERTGL